jgi:hypothetical protein
MLIIARQFGVDFISMISTLLKEVGKYVGTIVEASEGDHLEIWIL